MEQVRAFLVFHLVKQISKFLISRGSLLLRSNCSSAKVSSYRRAITVSSLNLEEGDVKKYFDFVVIGSGVAGLKYALEVSKHGSVAVITKAEPQESNTNYAQGGVSAVLCPTDSIENHMRDTIIAGAYLCDEETVKVILFYPLLKIEQFLDHQC